MSAGFAKRAFRTARRLGTFYIAEQSTSHLENLRMAELEVAVRFLPASGRLLELGAGSGWQARELAAQGYEVSAVDVPTSNYREQRVWPVTDYDGHELPFEAGTFDVVFSSNVLEHIPHVREFQSELQRVLRPGGVAVHLIPSGAWRVWTNVSYLLRMWVPSQRHGEHAANAIDEIRYFHHAWWERLFEETGWLIKRRSVNGLFYTGSSIMDARISVAARSRLSRVLGSACNVFVLSLPED